MCNWDLSKMYEDKNEIEKDIKLVNENWWIEEKWKG